MSNPWIEGQTVPKPATPIAAIGYDSALQVFTVKIGGTVVAQLEGVGQDLDIYLEHEFLAKRVHIIKRGSTP